MEPIVVTLCAPEHEGVTRRGRCSCCVRPEVTPSLLPDTRHSDMAAGFTLHSAVLRRALRGAFSLHRRTPGASATAAGIRSVCNAAPEANISVIQESTEEYKFVERLIPPSRVPAPPKHAGPTPSGWVPPAQSPPPLPYMIRRSRMHNIPVYTDLTHGNRKTTLVRKVEGDIWALEKDVKQHLKEVTGKELPTQVNEVTMTLKVKGHFDKELKDWLTGRGFWMSLRVSQFHARGCADGENCWLGSNTYLQDTWCLPTQDIQFLPCWSPAARVSPQIVWELAAWTSWTVKQCIYLCNKRVSKHNKLFHSC